MNFVLNQIFEGTYPPEAAQFCNQNGYRIVEIDKQTGKRRFQIQELPAKPAELVQAELESGYKQAVQSRLDTFARTKDYDSIISVCSYAQSSVPTYKAEAERAIVLRDTTWEAYFAILEAVVSEQRTVPTVEELLSELPELTWE